MVSDFIDAHPGLAFRKVGPGCTSKAGYVGAWFRLSSELNAPDSSHSGEQNCL